MQHNFDVSIAEKYGVNEAIFLNNLAYWIHKNMANEKHYHENRYWTYNSVESYKKLFPYWSSKSLRIIIQSCIKNNLILKGNFNKLGYDRTTWYALTDNALNLFPWVKNDLEPISKAICPKGQMELPDRANGVAQKGKPIPNKKPNKKTQKERVPERGGRFPLSALSNFDLSEITKALVKKNMIDEKLVKTKFKNHVESKGKKIFKRADLENWFLSEIQHLSRSKTKQKNEVRSTVPDFEPEKDQKKYTSKDTARTKLKEIREALGYSSHKGTIKT